MELRTIDLLADLKLGPNRFAGTCSVTGEPVPAGAGFVYRSENGWTTLSKTAAEELRRAEVLVVTADEESEVDDAETERANAEAREIVGKENGPFILKARKLRRVIRFGDELDPSRLRSVDPACFTAALRRAAFLRCADVQEAMGGHS